MRILEIDRIAILTPDIEESMERWSEQLDLDFNDMIELELNEPVDTSVAYPGIEFMSPKDVDGPLGDYLDEHGPGMHVLILRVEDTETAVSDIAESGIEPIRKNIEDGYALYHPDNFDGVLVELTEYSHPRQYYQSE